jgi:hypothetical protein
MSFHFIASSSETWRAHADCLRAGLQLRIETQNGLFTLKALPIEPFADIWSRERRRMG